MSRPPYHNNTLDSSGKVLFWNSTDSETLWKNNMLDSQKKAYLQLNGWDTETAFTYCYNSDGFRTLEFDSTPGYVALGCSFTEGIGLPVEYTWPRVLEHYLETKVINLGVYGASLDTCFRLLDYYIDKINILGVFLLEPDKSRVEVHRNDYISTLMASNTNDQLEQSFFKLWSLDSQNANYNRKKNLYSMIHLCNSRNIPFINSSTRMVPIKDTPARDFMHPGKEQNKILAELFFKKFSEVTNGNR